MPIIIMKRFNSPEHGYSVEEAIAVFNGDSVKNYVDHLNNQETLLRMSIERFIEIQRHVRSILPPLEKKMSVEKYNEWKDKYTSKVIELASSWIKDFPSDFISYFQEFGQLPTIIECHYYYKEVEFVN